MGEHIPPTTDTLSPDHAGQGWDTHRLVRQITAHIPWMEKVDIITAPPGPVALGLIYRLKPDVVILDGVIGLDPDTLQNNTYFSLASQLSPSFPTVMITDIKNSQALGLLAQKHAVAQVEVNPNQRTVEPKNVLEGIRSALQQRSKMAHTAVIWQRQPYIAAEEKRRTIQRIMNRIRGL